MDKKSLFGCVKCWEYAASGQHASAVCVLQVWVVGIHETPLLMGSYWAHHCETSPCQCLSQNAVGYCSHVMGMSAWPDCLVLSPQLDLGQCAAVQSHQPPAPKPSVSPLMWVQLGSSTHGRLHSYRERRRSGPNVG